jgi:hypothetical protein
MDEKVRVKYFVGKVEFDNMTDASAYADDLNRISELVSKEFGDSVLPSITSGEVIEFLMEKKREILSVFRTRR